MPHERTSLVGEPFQLPQGQGDPPDHQIPAPVEGFTQGETAGAFGQFRLDGQTQATGQAARQAWGEIHADSGIPQLARCRSHQDEGFRWRELHRLRSRGVQSPFDRREDTERPSQSFQQHLTGLIHLHLPQLQGVGS